MYVTPSNGKDGVKIVWLCVQLSSMLSIWFLFPIFIAQSSASPIVFLLEQFVTPLLSWTKQGPRAVFPPLWVPLVFLCKQVKQYTILPRVSHYTGQQQVVLTSTHNPTHTQCTALPCVILTKI